MSQAITRRNLTNASLWRDRAARSVLVRMAHDEARAERVRQIKADNPDLTWASIAEAVGVKERSAVQWAATGGISYENAKKLARHTGVDLDWLWRGETSGSPDLMGTMSDGSQLDRIEALVRELRELLLDPAGAIAEALANAARRERQPAATKKARGGSARQSGASAAAPRKAPSREKRQAG